jgi:hypothetical protein
LQRWRAQLQSTHYRNLISQGLSASEGAALGAMSAASAARLAEAQLAFERQEVRTCRCKRLVHDHGTWSTRRC